MESTPDTQPHLRQIAESAESFCIRLDYERIRLIAQDIFMHSKSQLLDGVIEGLYSQNHLEQDFHVNLLDRHNIGDAGAIWKEYTNMYFLRLLGTTDESSSTSSTDYSTFCVTLAAGESRMARKSKPIVRELPDRDLPRMTPSLGSTDVRMMYFVWDKETMVFSVELSKSFTGITVGDYHDIHPSSNVDAHIVVGSLDRSCTAALAGRDLIRRWKAKNLSKGNVEEHSVGANSWFLIPGDIRPVLAAEGMSDAQGVVVSEEAPIASPDPRSVANSRAIVQPAQHNPLLSPEAFEDSLLVSTHQTLKTNTMTLEDKQRQHWKDLATNVESFCLRFDPKSTRAYVFRTCSDPCKEQYKALQKIASQYLVKHDFHVNLLHRRDMAILPDVWSAYTELYEGRLLGLHDESISSDYNAYLAALLKHSESIAVFTPVVTKEETSTTPSLGQMQAGVQYLVWDDTTMIFTILLKKSWYGKNGVRYEVPDAAHKLAHILIGTLNRDNPDHLEIGEDLIKRWHANDHSRGRIRTVDMRIGLSSNRSGDVHPILPVKPASPGQQKDVVAESPTMGHLHECSAIKPMASPRERPVPDHTPDLHVGDVINSAKEVATTPTVNQVASEQDSHTDHQVPIELIKMTPHPLRSSSPKASQP